MLLLLQSYFWILNSELNIILTMQGLATPINNDNTLCYCMQNAMVVVGRWCRTVELKLMWVWCKRFDRQRDSTPAKNQPYKSSEASEVQSKEEIYYVRCVDKVYFAWSAEADFILCFLLSRKIEARRAYWSYLAHYLDWTCESVKATNLQFCHFYSDATWDRQLLSELSALLEKYSLVRTFTFRLKLVLMFV